MFVVRFKFVGDRELWTTSIIAATLVANLLSEAGIREWSVSWMGRVVFSPAIKGG